MFFEYFRNESTAGESCPQSICNQHVQIFDVPVPFAVMIVQYSFGFRVGSSSS